MRDLSLLSFFNGLILIDINFFNFNGNLLVDIDDPVGSHPRMATIRMLEDFLFRHFSHSIVIELPPFVIVTVFDEGEVVPTHSISIMNANGLKVIWVLIHSCIGLLNFSIYLV
jgi:hypothetical protein